ncbi:phycobilisome degradation family protein [Scytonema hofmannii PCC 7110]|uniref:Phycobilisome degradation family protein n=1 Tax=Scytonema hofmannii PCC 7110 TaxID=128403 RepID=A0A139X8A9_9CYAN|nr:NblA/ycf18 family protein [Scytonema hofmannii]KYC40872.1 phycobilisome degradation family protein [Scytonema hofmannii PCC 7110]
MNQSVELSLEQQFNLRIFEDSVRQMSREQAQNFLIELHEHMMLKDNMYKTLLKQDWGINADQMSV